MSMLDRLRDELTRAGRAAQEALDEGKLRLDLMRSRQAMDRAAQKLGYAVYRARKSGGEIPTDEYARLSADLMNTEAEIERYETLIREAAGRRKTGPESASSGSASSAPPE